MTQPILYRTKNLTLRVRAADIKIFEEVKIGLKSIETRAGTIKYQPIEVGDTLIFVCGQNRCVKKVVKKFHWENIDAMVKEIDFKKVMPSVESINEMKKIYKSYPNYEKKIKEQGLLGFELE
jgi:ASC-1-like (ASCH) protein